nr:alpha/beta hydrolase-fold protein [Lysobacter spongiae]
MKALRAAALSLLVLLAGVAPAVAAEPAAQPLVIGDGFNLDSAILGETRRINVYRPTVEAGTALPVLYMPDGGLGEDFLHVAGLLQVGSMNGTTRPFLLVGIENTERRRDMTGPTEMAEDREIAPNVGGSTAFRRFIANELMPEIARRYRVTDESAIVGESLAGLFVVETLVEAPGMFDTYIAIDPSLWWNGGALARRAAPALAGLAPGSATVFLANSDQAGIAGPTAALATALGALPGLSVEYRDMPAEHHHTVYHPAALAAFRSVLAPPAGP